MRKIAILISFLITAFNLLAYDYQTVYSHRTVYFNDDIESIQSFYIDSLNVQDMDSVFYPVKNLQHVKDDCYTLFGAGMFGEKILVNKDWNYFFSYKNDTIRIKTSAELNESFLFLKNKDFQIEAKLIKWDEIDTLGFKDLVKTYRLSVYDNSMQPLTDHPWNAKEFQISKSYGFTKIFNLYYLGEERTFVYGYDLWLSGMINPIIGTQNITWFEVFDFQPGDELHIKKETYYTLTPYHAPYRSLTKIKYLARTDYSDSIVYTIKFIKIENDNYLENSIKKEVIRKNEYFDKQPGLFFVLPLVDYGVNMTQYKDEMKFESVCPIMVNNNDSCWEPMNRERIYPGKYVKGKGGPYYQNDSIWGGVTSRELVYYKKGTETFGEPLDFSEYESFAPIITKWYYNQEVYSEVPEAESIANYLSLESVGDTLILGKKFSHIILTHGSGDCYLPNNSFFYQSNDTVYSYSEDYGEMTPLYIWDARKGDEWEVKMSEINRYKLRVDSVGFVEINNRTLRRQFVSFLSVEKENETIDKDIIIEGIGGLKGLGRLWSSTNACDNWGASLDELRCYVHPEYGTYKTSDLPCDYNSSVESTNAGTLQIFPNPAGNNVKLKFDTSTQAFATVSIINSLGETVLSERVSTENETELNLSKLAAGIYFIKVQSGNHTETQKLIKQ